MACKVIIKFSFCVVLLFNLAYFGHSKPDVAIIGAGIGGASCAYYLKQWVPQANVTILEANDRIGGRIEETTIDGVTVELGANAWATSNRYIAELVKKLGIPVESNKVEVKKKTSSIADSLMVWDGSTLTPVLDLVTKDIPSVAETLVAVGEFLVKLETNYIDRDTEGKAFHDLNQYVDFGNLFEYTNESSKDFFGKHRVSDLLQTFGIEPIVRVIYGQDLTVHAFASLVSLTSVVETPSSATGGNAQLPKTLIQASKANVHLNSRVTSVSKDASGRYTVVYNGLKPQQLAADVVILAAPLEWTNITFRIFPVDPLTKQPRRTWAHWYVHHVSATGLNNKFFNQPTNWNKPQDILTTSNASTPWATIQLVATQNGLNIYKLFCFKNITSTISQYFVGVKTVHVKYWRYTFPELAPIQTPSQFQAIQLDSNLFNINTMESVASAMEGSVISGRNVAMLVKEKWSFRGMT